MYAVIVSGGKQYRVIEGQTLKLEKMELEVGATMNFEQVIMVADGDKILVNTADLKNAKVEASILSQGRHKKIHIMKFRRRKHHQKQMGHRQYFTEVKITAIQAG